MLFSSPVFLFLFLPSLLFIYYFFKKAQNLVLLLGSIFFYFWGEPDFIIILLIILYLNYHLGVFIENLKSKRSRLAKVFLILSISLNLIILAYYKYRFFLLSNLNSILVIPAPITNFLNSPGPFLPLAISFFVFHAISYQVDIYKNISKAQRSLSKLALYFLMFPHLLAGPILRYHQIQEQLSKRQNSHQDFSLAINRFVFGLAKKVLIADRLGSVANEIFAIPAYGIDTPTAWLGIICFTLQIYFDFSSYSDMAIGLAYMFGFKFPENFNYPYTAFSIQDFWRRWHITLSNWIRDYIYIPLGGSRKGELRTYLNLSITFCLAGLWHGANWNFVIWGLIFGLFLSLERMGKVLIEGLWRPIRHFYTLAVVMLAWVFFRTDNLDQAFNYLKALFGIGDKFGVKYRPLEYFISPDLILVLVIGVLISFPIHRVLKSYVRGLKLYSISFKLPYLASTANIFYFVFLLFLCLIVISAQTYQPFIYFRF